MNELIGSADGKKFRNYAQQFTLDVLLGYANAHLAQLAKRYRLERVSYAGMPSLALADKVLGRAQKIGLLQTDAPAPFPIESEDELGPLLLAIVSAAKALGLDSERALRSALRDLQAEIRAAEATPSRETAVVHVKTPS